MVTIIAQVFVIVLCTSLLAIVACINIDNVPQLESEKLVAGSISSGISLEKLLVKKPTLTVDNQQVIRDEVEILSIASRKMLDLAKLTMQISSPEEDLPDLLALPTLLPGKNTTKKSQIIFNAFTERPTPKDSNISYTKTNATDGNPIDAVSGVYTVKTSGLYGFIFHAVTNELKVDLPTVQLLVNGKSVAMAAAYNGGTFKALTIIAGARLKHNDKVSVFVTEGHLFENGKGSKHRASFAGTFMN